MHKIMSSLLSKYFAKTLNLQRVKIFDHNSAPTELMRLSSVY